MIILKAGKQQKTGKTKAAAASLSSCDMRDSCSFLTFETTTVTNTCDEDMSRPSDQKTRYDAMQRDRNATGTRSQRKNICEICFYLKGKMFGEMIFQAPLFQGKKAHFFLFFFHQKIWKVMSLTQAHIHAN